MSADRPDHEGPRGGLGPLGIAGLCSFLCGLGMGIASAVAFFDEQVAEIPGLDEALPIATRSDPAIAIVLVLVGVVLIALDAGRREDRS